MIELTLRGDRAKAPASVVEPLLVSDLPVFLRWRGEPPSRAPRSSSSSDVTDRLIVDSTEWADLPRAYTRLVELFPRCAASDIAWARTSRWRSHLATLWPGIAEVGTVRVTGTATQAWLLCGWLRSRLDRADIALEHEEAKKLEGVALDGEGGTIAAGRSTVAERRALRRARALHAGSEYTKPQCSQPQNAPSNTLLQAVSSRAPVRSRHEPVGGDQRILPGCLASHRGFRRAYSTRSSGNRDAGFRSPR